MFGGRRWFRLDGEAKGYNARRFAKRLAFGIFFARAVALGTIKPLRTTGFQLDRFQLKGAPWPYWRGTNDSEVKSTKLTGLELVWERLHHVYNSASPFATRAGMVLFIVCR